MAWPLVAILVGSLLSSATPVAAASLPDFMEHWEFGLNVEEDDGPDYSSDLIFPLYRRPGNDGVAFVEPRMRYADGEWLFNTGWGWRQLTPDKAWLLGANMFHDYETQYSHYRLGWGLEALSPHAEFRSNYYLGLSQERLVEEDGPTQRFEQAVDGFDFEMGAPVPYYSRLKLFGGFNTWNYKNFKNRYGWVLRSEYTPWPFLVVDGRLDNDTKGNLDWGMTVAFRFPFGGNAVEAGESWRRPLQLDATIFPEGDASQFLFSLVERHHDIVVEQRTETAGVSIEIARGT